MKYEESIDEELERIALYIERMHNRLMDIYFSLEKEDEKKKKAAAKKKTAKKKASKKK